MNDLEKEEETREFQYIYFIENHIETSRVKLFLSRKQTVADNLECVKVSQKEKGQKEIYIYSIYRFKFYSSRVKENFAKIKENIAKAKENISKHLDIQFKQKDEKVYDITIEMEDENEEKFEKKLSIKDFEKDIFIFDFKFDKNKGWILDKEPPKSYSFTLEEQFLIYVDFLRNGYIKLKQQSRQNYGLILSVQSLLVGKDKKFNFTFYLIILLECFATPLVQRHLQCFKPSKIETLGIISEEKLKQIKNILNVFERKPNKVLLLVEENSKLKYGIKLFAVILYFTIYFDKDRIPELLKDQNNTVFIYSALLEYNTLFDFLKLDSEQMQLLIKITENFDQLGIALTYTKNVQELLDVICLNFEKIFQLYTNKNEDYKIKTKNREKIKKPIINILELAIPDRKDCMQTIYDLYCSIITIESNHSKEHFINFSPSFFETYISYFDTIDIDSLIKVKEMINFSKKFSININLKNDIIKIVHENGLLFSTYGKLKNINLLDFITSKDEYYILPAYKKLRSPDILNGLDISSFDDDFYKKWKSINWNDIFKEQKFSFYEKILTFIKDLNDFNILYKLFDLNEIQENNVIEQLQKKIVELYKNYNPEKHLNFIEDIIILIYHSDKKNAKIDSFLTSNIQKNFNAKLVNKIYINLLSKYGDEISQKAKKIIAKFFTQTPDNMNPDTLLYLISNCPKCVKNIFQSLEKYYIKKEDFLKLEDTDKYKLFKGLLENNYLDKQEFQNTYYIQNSIDITNKLIRDIEKGELMLGEISTFYNNKPEDKLQDKLLERMTSLCLNSKEKGEKYKRIIDNFYSAINLVINDLQLILEDLLEFYLNKESKNIEEIKTIINELKTGKLNCYEKKYTQRYSFFVSTYKDNADKRAIKRKSKFFWTIYNKNKEKYKANEDACVDETIKEFDKLKDIFTDGVKSLEKNVLQDCLITIKGKNEEEIVGEILTLKEIFQIKDCDEDEIRKSMILLSKKEDIYNISIAISLFLEKLEIKEEKNSLLEKLKEIIEKLENSNDEIVILNAIKDLKSFSIDIDILYDKNNKDDNYLNILLKLKEQPDAIIFLTKINFDSCSNLQEVVGEIDNAFLNANDILDLEKCVEFISKLEIEQIKKNKTDAQIINIFNNEVSKNKGIGVLFTRYVNNYSELKSLIDYGLDKSEASKKKISFICKKSTFFLTNIKNEFFKGIYKDEEENKGQKKEIETEITMDNLLELRDRVQLTKKVTGDKQEIELLEKYKKFIEIVTEIYNLYGLIQDIYKSGYPETISIEITINNYEPQFNGCGLESNKYSDFFSKLKDILTEIRKQIKISYKDSPIIRFIYGRLFNLIYNSYTKKEKENNKISSFLKFMSNNLIKEENINFTNQKTENIYDDLIKNSINYIEQILEKNKLNINDIMKQNLISQNKKDIEFKGIYIYKCEELEKELFQLYKYLTNQTPAAQAILLCNKETTTEELTAFLYRAILCDFNSCFIIAGVELLEFDKKSILLEILNDLNAYFTDGELKQKSCLIIAYTNSASDIVKSLETLKYKKILDISKKHLENLKIENSKVEIISSDQSGVGKSTQIKLSTNNKQKYIYFPFGGVFNREDIIERLKNLVIPNNSLLHLDLYDTEQTALMTEFLFSILITKLYGQNEDIFYLPKEIEIKIEIPNGFIDFMKKFPILTLFPTKAYTIKKLEPLIVPKQIDSNIQVVANYLKALEDKTIDTKDLFFDKITPIDFKYLNMETIVEARILSQKECQRLIFQKIKETIKEPNYYQIKTFIDILATQFKKLNQSYYLNAKNLKLHGGLNTKRTFLVKSFIEITQYFTKGAFDNILKAQQSVHKTLFRQYDENKYIDSGMKSMAEDKHFIISFDKIDPSLLFFHEGNGEQFSFITTKVEGDEEYENITKLKNFQVDNNIIQIKGEDEIEEVKKVNKYVIPNYKNYEPDQFLPELKEILDLNNPIDEKEKSESGKKNLKEIAGTYVFTADNFVKMVLILLRIRANIPVIMMGETGCGKTSLIRKLSELINNGSSEKMKILNIHAGTNDKDIINFLEKNVIDEAKTYELIENEEKQNLEKKGMIYYPKKVWVFLDEINTCKSMGLISELMCKHTYQGKPLPSNIVFIAACNPYRQGKKNVMSKAGLDLQSAHQQLKFLDEKEKEKMKKSMNNSLVYTVNPLPHSLLNFVFDFGNLEEEDEKNYIKSIIKEPIYHIFNENKGNLNKDDLDKIHMFAKDMIVCAQNFIREKNDISSVSLREIRRFNIFYEFFIGYLKNKKDFKYEALENRKMEGADNFYKNLDEFSLQIYSVILSIFVCYYLRITDNETRKEIKEKFNDIIKTLGPNFEKVDFLDVPNKEELYVVDNIRLPKGIAKNRALLDNIFSLFVAINNKVPIFIVGKPGCSKSLSVQLINKAMKGSSSYSSLFKSLPKIILNSYQGSMGSTSQGVLKVFQIARKKLEKLKDEDKKNNISMIFFDEMGLAEHSPNNPLKVIHSELEYDLNEGDKKIAFVGISNWSLDASKMNRGIYLSIPDPNEIDIKETALTIGSSYDQHLAEQCKDFFENLGEIYYQYKNYLKEKHNLDGKDEFHGNRDFYHLVKNAARILVSRNKTDIEDNNVRQMAAVSSIERNFGGLQFNDIQKTTSLEIIKKKLKDKYHTYEIRKEYDVLNRITENINDKNSRYLLVISKSSISTFLLSSILSSSHKKYSFYIGSQFQNDLQSEEYSLKILNKIQLHMEQGKILILKNLESVYPALYDLFNQNFQEMGEKKYARIAIGSSTNAFSLVNDKFRCIVNVDESQLNQEEPPFLNRFEKHIISFEFLLKKELIEESNRIYNILKELITYDKNVFKGINYDLEKIFINFNKEEIQGIIYEADKKNIIKQNLINEVINKFSLILPQDIMFCMKVNGFISKYPDISKQLNESYLKGEHMNFSKFLESMKNKLNVVYTFSNILNYIENLDNIDNDILGEIKNENIKQLKISSFRSENEFEKQIDEFFNEKKYKLCLIKFTSNEGNFLNYIKFFIENKEREYFGDKNNGEKFEKAFVFIVHLVRAFNTDKKKSKGQNETNKNILKETISHLSGYYQIFIDDLNGDANFSLENVIYTKGKDLFEKCFDFKDIFKDNIYPCLSYMKYNFSHSIGELNEETYVNKLIKYFEVNPKLVENINDIILRQMEKEEDLILQIFKSENSIDEDDIDLVVVFKKLLYKIYKRHLYLLYFKCEQDQFFSTLLSNEEESKDNKNNAENVIFEEEIDQNEQNNNQNNIAKEKEKEKNKIIINEFENIYLKHLIYNENNKKFILEQLGVNELNIILGLNLPGIKSTIDLMNQKFKTETLLLYRQNENCLRQIDNWNEEILQRNKRAFFETLNKYNESTYNELLKNKIFSEILDKENNENNNKNNENNNKREEELFDLFLDDYYTLFIYEKIYINNNKEKKFNQDELNSIKKLLELILDIRSKSDSAFIDEDITINTISKINWIEAYSEELAIILTIFLKLNDIINNLYEKIKKVIEDGTIKYEISERNRGYTSFVNKAIFFGIESIIRVVTSNEDIYIDIKDEKEKFSQLIKINKEILQEASKIQMNLNLYSKEIHSLQEILLLNYCFNANNIDTPENITKLIKYFSNETILINNEQEDELIDNFEELYNDLSKKIGNDKSFYQIISIIFKNEYDKVTFDRFRDKILNIILKNNDFIYKNNQIFKLIIRIGDTPDEMENYLDNTQDSNSILIKTINNYGKNEYLEQLIINIFENKILSFFNNIPNLDFNNEDIRNKFERYSEDPKETNIIFDLPQTIFGKCIQILDVICEKNDENDDEEKIVNQNICKLYAISYIKIYLNKLIYLVYHKEQEINGIQDIVQMIIGSDSSNKLRRVIKIYVFKLFFNLMNKNWDEFTNYDYKNKQIEFIDILLNEENESQNTYLAKYLLPNEPKEYENINELFNNNKKKYIEENKNLFGEFIKNNGLDAFIIVSINQIISKLMYNDKDIENEYQNFSKMCGQIFKDYEENIKKLLFLFLDEEQYKNILKPKIEEQKNEISCEGDPFESLLYGYRFCVESLNNNNKKSLYKSILTQECLNSIKKSYIPGNFNTIENISNDKKITLKIGINYVPKERMTCIQKKVRSLGEISFRLLNFILYNHLFFANCLNYYPNEEFKKDLKETGINCLEIIQINWNLLEESLKKRNIANIQIFMNLIFKKLSEIIKNCPLIKSEKELNKFEEEIEKLIESCINDYPDYSKKYMEINEKLTSITKKSLRAIISELEPPNEELYPYNEYPFLKYFIYTKYQTIEDLKKYIGEKESYMNEFPLLYKYLLYINGESEAKNLKYLPIFNEFTNLMVNYYSFNITREDSKTIKMCDQTILNNEGFNDILDTFISSFNKIKDKAKEYNKKELEEKTLSSNDKLAYFLNDNNEPGFGMYIAAAFEYFIKSQNEFLDHIINNGENNKNNKNIYYCIDNMKKRIPVQYATENQILLIDNCFFGSIYDNFEDLINTFCKRNIFEENGKINYLNYNSFIYEIDSIEEELAKLILPGKCLFDKENNLNFVAYLGEGFNKGKSDILNKFYSKYTQNELDKNDKTKIINYIKTHPQFGDNYDFKPFFDSMQLIIFYLINNSFNNHEEIKNILMGAPTYLRINEDCSEFLRDEDSDFKVDKIMNLFLLFEHLCFNDLCLDLPDTYKVQINEETQKKIEELKNKFDENLTIKEFGAALRRFISRYLTGKKQKSDISPKNSMIIYLNKTNLWDEKRAKLDNLGEIISNLLIDLNLNVEQSFEFYNLIKEKDEEEIKFYEEFDEINKSRGKIDVKRYKKVIN